jgi:hypothetical protein
MQIRDCSLGTFLTENYFNTFIEETQLNEEEEERKWNESYNMIQIITEFTVLYTGYFCSMYVHCTLLVRYFRNQIVTHIIHLGQFLCKETENIIDFFKYSGQRSKSFLPCGEMRGAKGSRVLE